MNYEYALTKIVEESSGDADALVELGQFAGYIFHLVAYRFPHQFPELVQLYTQESVLTILEDIVITSEFEYGENKKKEVLATILLEVRDRLSSNSSVEDIFEMAGRVRTKVAELRRMNKKDLSEDLMRRIIRRFGPNSGVNI